MTLRHDAPMSWAQQGSVGECTRWGGEKEEKGNKIFPATLDAHRG
jgi:hypothetical protein